MILMFGYSQEKETVTKDTSATEYPEDFRKFLQKIKHIVPPENSLLQEEADARTNERTLQCAYEFVNAWRYNLTTTQGDVSEITKYPRKGKVGIGVCEPLAKLHIGRTPMENGAMDLFRIETSEIEQPGVISNQQKFLVDNYGYVSIGAGKPLATLHLQYALSSLLLGMPYNSYLRIASGDPAYIFSKGELWLASLTYAPIRLGMNASGRVFVDGRLGVKVSNPQADLEVRGGARFGDGGSNYLEMGYNGANAFINFESSNPNAGVLHINYYSGRPVVIGKNLVVNNKLGIGTSPEPQFSLSVCGKIHATELKVDPKTWCDYVFEEDYPLKPWKEVVQYYKTHKHLPGVPSQEEVEKEGIHVAEMNRILLEKIEELYRYIEQLEQRVRELERK